MNSPDTVPAFCASDGPTQPAVVRVSWTTSVPVPYTAHALPTLFFALELHDVTSNIMVYYYKRKEDSRGGKRIEILAQFGYFDRDIEALVPAEVTEVQL